MGRAPCCDENGLKKGPWTPEEDQKLVDYIQKHGHGSWRALPKNAGLQRCGKSCRLRWTNYLRPDIKRGKFSFEEEETILQLHAVLGNKWSAIAGRLPGRTDNEIKNYWNTHLKKRLLQMGIDPVTHRPRADLFAPSHLSHYFASLTHMTHWENARLEAEARWLTNYLKLAAACRSSSSSSGGSILNHPDISNLGFEGLGNMNVDLLRSMSANDPMGWGMNNCPTLDMGNNQMFHANTNSGENPSASNVGGSMVHLLDNMWQLALRAPSSSLLHATTDSCLSDETQLNNQANTGMVGYGKSIEEDIHEDVKNRFMHFQGRQPEGVPLPPNNDNNVDAMWGVHDNKSGSLPPLVSESCSPCLNASFNDKSCEQHQSSNHNAPSESLLFEESNQDMGGGMGSCSHHGDWVSEEEEGKEYWSHVLKFIDPETVPTGIEHIIRQD